jgi:hypothetical protein
VISEEALDVALAAVKKAKDAGAMSFWEMGQAVLHIYDQRLYTQRKAEDGKPKYKSFEQFARQELAMSKRHVFRMMDVARLYSRDDFQAVGVSKLAMIAQVPEEMATEMLERARAGLPLAQVTEEVRRLAGGKRRTAADTGRRESPGKGATGAAGTKVKKEKTAKPVPKPGPDELTVVTTKERLKVPMFARPKLGRGHKASEVEPKRAMKVDQDPAGKIELPNGTEMHVRIVLAAKGLEVHVEFRKSE